MILFNFEHTNIKQSSHRMNSEIYCLKHKSLIKKNKNYCGGLYPGSPGHIAFGQQSGYGFEKSSFVT